MAIARRIVPVADAGELAALPGVQQAANVTYHGGRVISAAEVVTVFWGSAWTQAPQSPLVAQINGFFDFILTSSLMDLLAEYGVVGMPIGHGRRTGSATITSPAPGGGSGSVSDADVQSTLQAWIGSGALAQPTANTVFFVYLPPGVTSTLDGQQSCQVYCGYHHDAGRLVYAVEPYADCAGCTFGGDVFGSLTKISSHELCEAITDPAGDGWYDDATGNEIGDICNATTVQLGGYTVQAEWSNKGRACLLAPPA